MAEIRRMESRQKEGCFLKNKQKEVFDLGKNQDNQKNGGGVSMFRVRDKVHEQKERHEMRENALRAKGL